MDQFCRYFKYFCLVVKLANHLKKGMNVEQNIWVGSFPELDDQQVQALLPFINIEPLGGLSSDKIPVKLAGIIVDKDPSCLNLPTWLPVIDVKQLNDPIVLHHFLLCSIIFAELNELMTSKLTRGAIIAFHSRYKLLLLAHSQALYRELGPFVAAIETLPIQQFIIEYRQRLMALLFVPSTPENHANVLSHMQGYFRPQLEAKKRQALADLIQDYLNKKVKLDVPINLIKYYLQHYPHPYLLQQAYFNFYPNIMPHHQY